MCDLRGKPWQKNDVQEAISSNPLTGWTVFTSSCCKICTVCLKRPKINEKEDENGQFLKICAIYLVRHTSEASFIGANVGSMPSEDKGSGIAGINISAIEIVVYT